MTEERDKVWDELIKNLKDIESNDLKELLKLGLGSLTTIRSWSHSKKDPNPRITAIRRMGERYPIVSRITEEINAIIPPDKRDAFLKPMNANFLKNNSFNEADKERMARGEDYRYKGYRHTSVEFLKHWTENGIPSGDLNIVEKFYRQESDMAEEYDRCLFHGINWQMGGETRVKVETKVPMADLRPETRNEVINYYLEPDKYVFKSLSLEARDFIEGDLQKTMLTQTNPMAIPQYINKLSDKKPRYVITRGLMHTSLYSQQNAMEGMHWSIDAIPMLRPGVVEPQEIIYRAERAMANFISLLLRDLNMDKLTFETELKMLVDNSGEELARMLSEVDIRSNPVLDICRIIYSKPVITGHKVNKYDIIITGSSMDIREEYTNVINNLGVAIPLRYFRSVNGEESFFIKERAGKVALHIKRRKIAGICKIISALIYGKKEDKAIEDLLGTAFYFIGESHQNFEFNKIWDKRADHFENASELKRKMRYQYVKDKRRWLINCSDLTQLDKENPEIVSYTDAPISNPDPFKRELRINESLGLSTTTTGLKQTYERMVQQNLEKGGKKPIPISILNIKTYMSREGLISYCEESRSDNFLGRNFKYKGDRGYLKTADETMVLIMKQTQLIPELMSIREMKEILKKSPKPEWVRKMNFGYNSSINLGSVDITLIKKWFDMIVSLSVNQIETVKIALVLALTPIESKYTSRKSKIKAASNGQLNVEILGSSITLLNTVASGYHIRSDGGYKFLYNSAGLAIFNCKTGCQISEFRPNENYESIKMNCPDLTECTKAVPIQIHDVLYSAVKHIKMDDGTCVLRGVKDEVLKELSAIMKRKRKDREDDDISRAIKKRFRHGN